MKEEWGARARVQFGHATLTETLMARRWLVSIPALLFTAALVAWLRPHASSSDTSPDRAPAALEFDRFYKVEIGKACGSFELPLDGNGHYELIVSSLGEAAETYRVTLSAECEGALGACGTSRQSLGCSAFPGRAWERVAGRDRERASGRAEARGAGRGREEATAGNVAAGKLPCCPTATAQRRFFLHVTAAPLEDEQGYVPVIGVLESEGERVRVYRDREVPPSAIAPGLADEIVRLLDDEIVPRSQTLVGEHVDVDGDGKLAVLITGWLGRLCGGATAVDGFVRSSDFRKDVEAPFGNCADVLYLNTALQIGPPLKAVLAHEYTHAVCFSRRLAAMRPVPLPEEADWLNEAIAHVAESEHQAGWSNLDRRIAAFLAAPEKSPLVVRDYYRAGLWRDGGCRGATCLFLQFCVDQFGAGLLRDLVDGPECGIANLERATGVRFPELFRRWTMALADDQIGPISLRGRLGECELAGLKRVAWKTDRGPCTLDLRGTTTSLVRLGSRRQTGLLRVSISADRGAALQLSVRRSTSAFPG